MMVRKILAGVTVALSALYVACYVVERVNPEASIINGEPFKALLVLLGLAAVAVAVAVIADDRAEAMRRWRKQQRRRARKSSGKRPAA